MPNLFSFDGKAFKAINPQAGWNDAYYASTLEASMGGANLAVVNGVSALSSYSLVPWLYRAVTKKAMLVSRMPFDLMKGERDVKDDPAYTSLMAGWRNKVYALAVSKIVTGAGYWYIETNAAGRNLSLRFLRPTFVQPVSDNTGLRGFRFTDTNAPGIPREIPLDRIVYSWALNLQSEVRPGPGEAAVVLGASSMLYALDAFAAQFFNSGGVPAQIFSVPQQMNEADKQNFQTFISRVMNGMRNAFRTVVVRNGVEVTQIGSKIKDTLAPELAQQQRESVAAGLGFPPAAISGDHQNKATADVITLTTMTDSIIPFTESLYEDINRQLFNRFDLEIVAHPERLEVMQDAQLAQAKAVSELTGGKAVLTLDEARELLGREPLPEDEEPEPPAPLPMAQPAPPPPPAPEPKPETEDPEEDDLDEEQPAKWARALAEVKAGRLVTLWGAECRTASQVRKAFKRHAHEPAAIDTEYWRARNASADADLAAAVKALAEFNALYAAPPQPQSITVNMPAQSFTLPAAAAAPIVVNVPEQPAPVVNVAAPNVSVPVTVQPADVTVTTPAPRPVRVVRDGIGRIAGLEAE